MGDTIVFMHLFFTISLEAVGSILLKLIYISIWFSIHFEGHHLFQTIFRRHQSHLFYSHLQLFSFYFTMMRFWFLGHCLFNLKKGVRDSGLWHKPMLISKPGLYFIKFKHSVGLFLVNITFLYFTLSLFRFFFVLYLYLLNPCHNRSYLIEFSSYLSHVLPCHFRFSFLLEPS